METSNTSTDAAVGGADGTQTMIDDLLAGMPAVEPGAAAAAGPAETAEVPRVEIDPKTGKPARTKDGRLRRARGRKPKAATEPATGGAAPGEASPASTGEGHHPPPPSAPAAPSPEDVARAACRASAETLAEMVRAGAVAIGGDEGEWVSPAEREAFVGAWEGYFFAKGLTDIPPWVPPAMVSVAFVANRARKPKTRTWLAGAYQSARSVVVRLYMKVRGM